jgi:DNA-binding FadR family transcriptional regulator
MDPSFETVSRRSLSEAVFEQLRARILGGAFEAGAALPSERALCERFGVNRGALREALKRLEQLRLVSIRQGESTRVLDFRTTGGLDLCVAMLFDEAGQLALPVARGFVEMRAALGPDIARLAAMRRRDAALVELDRLLAAMRASDLADAVALERLSFDLWRTLVRASDNIAYQMSFNTMERVWRQFAEVMAPTMLAEVSDLARYQALVRAVGRKQPAAARRHAEALVGKGTQALLSLLDGLGGGR